MRSKSLLALVIVVALSLSLTACKPADVNEWQSGGEGVYSLYIWDIKSKPYILGKAVADFKKAHPELKVTDVSHSNYTMILLTELRKDDYSHAF